MQVSIGYQNVKTEIIMAGPIETAGIFSEMVRM